MVETWARRSAVWEGGRHRWRKKENSQRRRKGAVKVKEGNSFPFSFVQLPRGSPFISLPLSCFSLPQIRDFLGFFFTSLFCPSHLVFIRNPKKHSTTFFLPLVWLCYCVCSVNASCRRLFLLSQLSLLFFSGSFSFLLSSPAYMWSNHRHWSPEYSKITPRGRSFLSFLLLFFLLHSCCGYEVRDRLSSVEQTSPGVMTHLSDMTSFQTPLAWPCYICYSFTSVPSTFLCILCWEILQQKSF